MKKVITRWRILQIVFDNAEMEDVETSPILQVPVNPAGSNQHLDDSRRSSKVNGLGQRSSSMGILFIIEQVNYKYFCLLLRGCNIPWDWYYIRSGSESQHISQSCEIWRFLGDFFWSQLAHPAELLFQWGFSIPLVDTLNIKRFRCTQLRTCTLI